jgi:hypothetical protein
MPFSAAKRFVKVYGVDNESARCLGETPRVQQFAVRAHIAVIFAGLDISLKTERHRMIEIACEHDGYTMTEVAQHPG